MSAADGADIVDEPSMPKGQLVAFVVLPLSGTDGSTDQTPPVAMLEPDWEGCAPGPVDCDVNEAPAFGPPVYVVNGLQYAELTEVQNGDAIAVLVPVEDPQCNLACGEYLSELTSDAGPGVLAGSLPSNVPCSSSASGVYLGLSLPIATVSGPGLQGRRDFYQYSLAVRDRCAAMSERIEGSLTVLFENELPYEAPPEKPRSEPGESP